MQALVKFAASRKIMVMDIIAADITNGGIEAVELSMDEFNECREELRADLLGQLVIQGATHVWFTDEIGTDKDPILGPPVEKLLEEALSEPSLQEQQSGRCFPEVKLDVLAENAKKYNQN